MMYLPLLGIIFGIFLGYIVTHIARDVALQKSANRLRADVGLPTKPVKYLR